jgi:iron complex outermembrane receptor protein
MKGNVYSSALIAGTTLAIGLTTPGFAVEDSSLDEIIVTARRVEERAQDVPISITVFNQEQLTNRNVVTAGDLATYTPSLAANTRFGPETTTFSIRGFTQEGNTAPSVAVYFGDVVAPRAQGGTAGGNGAGVGSYFDLQNVQVLKGPQGTLFGRNTTGGAVLLVPQKPTSQFEGYVEGSVGNLDMRRLQAVVNIPFSDAVRFRLGVDSQEQDGYLRNKSGIGPSNFNDVGYVAVRASLAVDLTPNIENYTIATYSTSDTNGPYFKVSICNPAPGPASGPAQILGPLGCAQLARQNARGDGFYDVENGNPFAAQHIRQQQIINTTTWQAGDALTVKNIASYAQFKQDQNLTLFGDNFFLAPGVPFVYVGLYRDPGTDSISQWTATDELQLQGHIWSNALVWQTGLYFEKSGPLDGFQGSLSPILLSCTDPTTFKCRDVLGTPTRPAGFIQESLTEYNFRDLGVYAQATYKLTSQLSLTGGIRYTDDRTEGTSNNSTIFFPVANTPAAVCINNPCRLNVVQESEKPTWLVDLEYKPIDDAMLYGKYARGYRQGGVNTNNTSFATWNPEKVDMFEIGAKTSFHGAISGTFNIAAFYNDFTDQQLAANAIPAPGAAVSPTQAVVNAGKSKIKGVEIEAAIRPIESLRFDFNYAYLDTKLESFTAPPFNTALYSSLTPTAVVGGDLTLSPRNKGSITGTYFLPVSDSIGHLSVGVTYTHTDKQISSSQTPIGTLPSTDLLNANLNWNGIARSSLDLALFATNVTNKQYVTSVSGSYNSAGFDSFIVGQPRMYGARLRYSF